ncbi:MAG: hypothetical protein GY786_17230 [Proteobacteria bacterium]|nr:hypothetical protein [Pseudomonadota bacterium]
MTDESKIGFNISVEVGNPSKPSEPELSPDRPFKIAILGNFSGKAGRKDGGDKDLRQRVPIALDGENFHHVIGQLGIKLHLNLGDQGQGITLDINEIGDFHPNSLFKKEPELSKLIKAGKEIKIQEESGHVDVVEGLLGKKEDPGNSSRDPVIQSLLKDSVEPRLLKEKTKAEVSLQEQIDQVLSENMRALLHHPDFQALESSWQSLHFLVSNLNLSTSLQIYLIDITKVELEQDLLEAETFQKTGLFKMLEKATAGTQGESPYSLITGDFVFGYNPEELGMLSALGKIAESFGAQFISGASSDYIGCSSLFSTPDPDDWDERFDEQTETLYQKLRNSSQAHHIKLVLPRYLTRLPWSRDPEYSELDFEEIDEQSQHLEYLWGNAAYLITLIKASVFENRGWESQNNTRTQLSGIPFHVFKAGGREIIKTSGEVVLSDRAVTKILNRGLIPLQCSPYEDSIQLPRIISIAAQKES